MIEIAEGTPLSLLDGGPGAVYADTNARVDGILSFSHFHLILIG